MRLYVLRLTKRSPHIGQVGAVNSIVVRANNAREARRIAANSGMTGVEGPATWFSSRQSFCTSQGKTTGEPGIVAVHINR